MCYQTSHIRKVEDLENRFRVKLHNELHRELFDTPQYHANGFTHPNLLVIPQDKPEVLVPGVWGIAPPKTHPDQIKSYYKEAVKYGGGLNAQSEKLFNHFIYKNAVFTQRCIIPVTGFFEPHEHHKKKYPFYIHREDDEPIGLAGIYTVIGSLITFSILTKKASPLFERIHNVRKRQPILLSETNESEWLNSELNASDITELIHSSYPDKELESYAISKDLYNPKENSNVATITDNIIYPELSA